MSLLGVAGALLGGILGRNSEKKAIAAQNEYNKPANVRARAEEAGFNPLLFVGPGVGQQTATGGANYLGAAVADASLLLADEVAKRKDAGKIDQLQAVNARLQEKVQALTLRPKVGGIYAQNVETPTFRKALGKSDVSSDRQAGSAAFSGETAGAAPASANDAVAPQQTNIYQRYWNDGQSTDVPLGPDPGEFMTGLAIGQWNRGKAILEARRHQTFGTPLSMRDGIEMPPGYKPKYPKSKADKVKGWKLNFGWPTGAPISGGW